MSKYNITINEINTDNDQHTAQGTILKNGEPVAFEAATIWYDGTRRWKVKEEGGLAVKTTESNFSTGERMAVARWLKAVSKDEELVGKSSGQGSGGSGIAILYYTSGSQLGSGGSVTNSGGVYYHKFTSGGTFSV